MVKLEDLDPNLDPLVKAALIDDDRPRVEEEKSAPEDKKSPTDEEQSENEDEQKQERNQSEDRNEVEEQSTEKENSTEDTKVAEGEDQPKLTRKEKRERRYIERLKRDAEQNSSRYRDELFQTDPNYKPLDYNSVSELEVDEISKDREKYGQNNFSRGAQTATAIHQQDSFWQATTYEDRMLKSNPKYAFLNEEDQTNFDPERAEEINGLFLELVGYNPQTNTVKRTDISWQGFVEAEVERMERWAGLNEDRIAQNAAAQRATAGIRPSGNASKGLGKLKAGDISTMSDADYAKYKDDIDRQIMENIR